MSVAMFVLAAFCVASLVDWRHGVFLTVVMAFIQDPMRKMVEGEPASFILFAAVVFGSAAFVRFARKGYMLPFAIPIFARYLRFVFGLFLAILVFQSINAYARFGSLFIPTLGFANYLAPFVALTIAYQFATSVGHRGIRRFLWLYFVLAAIALSTVLLERLGFAWPILGEVGPGIWISSHGGLEAYSGIFRASEVAAWHAATSSAVIIMLLTAYRPKLGLLLIALAAVTAIISVGVLTGRRKFIITIAIFAFAYMSLQAFFIRRSRGHAITLTAITGCIFAIGYQILDLDLGAESRAPGDYELYVLRTQTAFGDVFGRAYELGVLPITWAYNRFGLLGAGLGVGTQGINYIVDISQQIGGAAEGGLGKLMIELGAAGLITAIALAGRLGMVFFQSVREASSVDYVAGRLACGLMAILISNISTFAVATQVFGDYFVLIFLGICAGTCMALTEIARREAMNRISKPPATRAPLSVSTPYYKGTGLRPLGG